VLQYDDAMHRAGKALARRIRGFALDALSSALATNVHRVLTCCGESATLDLAGAGRV
jgi:hypothetical protein